MVMLSKAEVEQVILMLITSVGDVGNLEVTRYLEAHREVTA
jgi:hypothetical protein